LKFHYNFDPHFLSVMLQRQWFLSESCFPGKFFYLGSSLSAGNFLECLFTLCEVIHEPEPVEFLGERRSKMIGKVDENGDNSVHSVSPRAAGSIARSK
jgi:hypothetical protein